ncbi:cytochrome C [Flavobacterium plurextorum]|uniref:Cytochrome C n=1 Tax=Flavobacterium plurextorum TaxID=1114867 RepID=A0ABX4CVB0_9FLAO|nr:heme-binding domain-containing protein [Flavobacterium plurextorum]OXB08642.1 cytochrome C [Flavobacterium plurextorum]
MKPYIKKIIFVGAIVLVLIQFYQPARNSDYGQVLPIHFSKIYSVPQNVEAILQTSCYDCHSNNTRYPWYSNIQPMRFFMDGHISEGKDDLNFSEWGNYSKRKQETKLNRMIKQIKDDKMPLSSYTLIHRDAILDSTQKKLLTTWLESVNDSIAKNN